MPGEELLEINDQYRVPTDPAFLHRVVDAVRAHVDDPKLSVSLLLTDEAGIGKIHGEFLDDPSPTDVISFPLDDSVDVVVSVERAHRLAAERGHEAQAEVALYVVHGLLHACGYDDIDAADRRRMRVAEREILGGLGLEVDDVDAV